MPANNNTDVIHDLSTLPTDDNELRSMVKISPPRENSGGKGKSARVGFGTPEKIIYFQTPRVYIPFGTDTFKSDNGYEKLTLLITLRKEAKGVDDFTRLVRLIDEATVQHAFENQDTYFGTATKDYKSIEIIRDRFHPLLQVRDNYDPQLKLKIVENVTRVFEKRDGAMERVDGTVIPAKVTARAIVQFGPIWAVSGKFGVTVRAEQVLLVGEGASTKRGLDQCVLVDDDDNVEEEANKNSPYEPLE
jgi:hypothetical protein